MNEVFPTAFHRILSSLIILSQCNIAYSFLPNHNIIPSTNLFGTNEFSENEIKNTRHDIVSSQKATVWTEFGKLTETHTIKANLGQGFPNWNPPSFCRESLVETVMDETSTSNNLHQYTRTAGHPKLVNELSTRYSAHLREKIDPFENVAITVGASQALYLALQTLIEENDEIIVFEPFFDLYINQIKLAGGKPIPVPLTFVPYDDKNGGGEWILEQQVLEQYVNAKTRAIILNSPHNPTGKVFTYEEMQLIADTMTHQAHPDCAVLSDEVYKYIIHAHKSPSNNEESSKVECIDEQCTTFIQKCDGHVHFATLPNMYNKTITISSAGKTFSATGWQVGWCVGPSHLIKPIHTLLPYVQFCPSTLMQEALARSLHLADLPYKGHNSYYDYLKSTYIRKRDMLVTALKHAGFGVPDYDRTSGGGFFILARITDEIIQSLPSHVLDEITDDKRLDWIFCKWLAQEKGVLCIPSSPFFSNKGDDERLSDRFIRIAFCKLDETIESASLVFDELVSLDGVEVVNATDVMVVN